MAVTKRTRFEVLRRDNYTCRYCRSSEGALTIDHVTPVALGGTDDPDNLVACCKDCNAGKGSSSPDAESVAAVTEDALRWAKALQAAAQERAADRDGDREQIEAFRRTWDAATVTSQLPMNWESSVRRFLAGGLTTEDITDAVHITASRLSPWSGRNHFRYFCGICWSNIRDLQERAKQILDEEVPGGE
ncbi:HNH endonuclease [Luteipulveratus mongoliensis]|uniref:HNH endonuclease n=1 Tax=Luteipulveratus mongoliensis TaxID=571913 RepID=UPI000696DC67|nr:HNH endonuclease [Luteipulveratus mongoliensis]